MARNVGKQLCVNTKVEAPVIAALRNDMLRFAKLQLRDESVAEDAVQDAIVAALSSSHRFVGNAEIKTWVFAILRNKIIDILRERTRHPIYHCPDDKFDEKDDELFDERGFWCKEECPTNWGDPETTFVNNEFWRILDMLPNNIKISRLITCPLIPSPKDVES